MNRLALLLLAAALAMGLAGCATRITDAQAAELSQGRADVAAATACTDAEARNTLLAAAGARLMAGTADLDLPAAATPSAALVAADGTPNLPALAAEFQAAQTAAADPPSGVFGTALAWAGGLGLLALGTLRVSPGAFGFVAGLAHDLLAPKATKEMRAAQAKAAEVAEAAVLYGVDVTRTAKANGLGPEVEAMQRKAAAFQDRAGIRPAVEVLLARAKATYAERVQ